MSKTKRTQLIIEECVKLDSRPEAPSPNMMVPPEPSGTQQDIYLLRVTDKDIPFKDIISFCQEISKKQLVKQEVSKKGVLHYHAMIEECKDDIEKVRVKLKQKFSQLNSGHKYNLEIAKDTDHAYMYILKELKELDNSKELFIGGNYDKELLTTYLKRSYKKYSKDNFMQDLDKLEKEYYKKTLSKYYYDYDEVWLLSSYVELKIKYNQTVIWRNACSMVEKIHLKRNPEQIKQRAKDEWVRYINPPNFHGLN